MLHLKIVLHFQDEHDWHVETTENIGIMYNLLEYSDNYADFSGSLYQFKRDESPMNDTINPLNNALNNSNIY